MTSPDPQGLAVRTEGLVKRFGRETALAGVDISVPEGAVYLLAGTNGAGKSTLLRTLLNIERPNRGKATVLGLDSAANGPEVRASAGYVPETGEGTYGWMRAGRFLAHHAGYQAQWDEEYAQHLVRLLDTLSLQEMYVSNAIAAELKGSPRIEIGGQEISLFDEFGTLSTF